PPHLSDALKKQFVAATTGTSLGGNLAEAAFGTCGVERPSRACRAHTLARTSRSPPFAGAWPGPLQGPEDGLPNPLDAGVAAAASVAPASTPGQAPALAPAANPGP